MSNINFALADDCNLKEVRSHMAGYFTYKCTSPNTWRINDYNQFDKKMEIRNDALIKQFWQQERLKNKSVKQQAIDYTNFYQRMQQDQPLL